MTNPRFAASRQPDSLARRGVWTLPLLSHDGYPVLVAVDSQSRNVARRTLRPDVDPAAAERELWEQLDAVDPIPRLRLVRVERPARNAMTPTLLLALSRVRVRP